MKKNLKEVDIHVRLSEKENKILKANADSLGLSISQYIRMQCIYKPKK